MNKTFIAKPWASGAAISWMHYDSDDGATPRTGVVWDRGPTVAGVSMVVWVIPDEPLPGDLYSAIAVGKSSRPYNRGAAISFNSVDSDLGSLTAAAARSAARVRA